MTLVDWSEVVDRMRVRQMYEEAFPASVRAPWEEIENPRSDEEILVWQANGKPVAFLLVRRLGPTSAVFVRYLAVDRAARGSGVGSEFWSEFVRRASAEGVTTVLLDVEDPDTDPAHATEHRRRIAFYERLGLSRIPGEYVPPDHGQTGEEVPLLLMGASLKATPIDGAGAIEAVMRYRYGVR